MMTILLEKTTDALNGEIKKYMQEIKPNYFVGANLSATIRDALWKKITETNDVKAIIVYDYNNEQGYKLDTHGYDNKDVLDIEGLSVVVKKNKDDFTYEHLMAKTVKQEGDVYKSLLSHMYETYVMTKTIMTESVFVPVTKMLAKYMEEDINDVVNYVSLLSANHDIGKAHPSFQENDNALLFVLKENGLYQMKEDGFRHEEYGSELMYNYLYDLEGFSDRNADFFSQITALHHQRAMPHSDNIRVATKKWKMMQDELYKKIRDIASFNISKDKRYHKDMVGMLILSIMQSADRMTSSNIFDNKTYRDFITRDDYFKHLTNQARIFLKRNHYEYNPIKEMKSFSELFNIPKNSMYDVQKKMVDWIDMNKNDLSLMICESPCGTGKTESALYVALKVAVEMEKQGVIIAMPTFATSKTLLDRVNECFEKMGIDTSILNSSRSMFSDNAPNIDEIGEWNIPTSHRTSYRNIIGPIDQIIKAVQLNRSAIQRFLGLVGKVVVIDEYHSYDAYMLKEITRLITFLIWLDVPVIILSATLASYLKKYLVELIIGNKHEKLLNSYPVITICTRDKKLIQIEAITEKSETIEYEELKCFDNLEVTAALSLNRIKNGGCMCVFKNTVDDANKLYKILKSKIDNMPVTKEEDKIELILYHSRFPEDIKEKKTEELLEKFGKKRNNRPYKAIVVASPMLEQSVNVDFDWIFTDLCPIDLLLQRIGRSRRHNDIGTIRELMDVGKTKVYVLTSSKNGSLKEKYGNSIFIYHHEILESTSKILKDMNGKIRVPEDMKYCIDSVYNENNISFLRDGAQLSALAEMVLLDEPQENVFQFYNKRQLVLKDNENNGTRYSEYETVEIGLITQKQYDIIQNSKKLPFDLCKEIINKQTVKIGVNKIKDFTSGEFGKGMLSGILLFIMDDAGMIHGDNGKIMYIDNVFGLTVE